MRKIFLEWQLRYENRWKEMFWGQEVWRGVREKKWGWYPCEGKSVEGGSKGWFGRGGMQVRSGVHTVCRGMET